MKATPRFSRPASRSSGVALVVTLAFVVIVLVVVIGFFDSSRLDRSAAEMHLARARATSFAHEGIERTVATLQKYTNYRYQGLDPDGVTPRTYYASWVSQPGALIVADPALDKIKLANPADTAQSPLVPLSSGAPTATTYSDPVYAPPNLNIQTLADQNPPTYLITDRPDLATGVVQEMKVRWIYVREDRSASATDPTQWVYDYYPKAATDPDVPVLDAKKPIIGRFAYWTDDESSKINYNLAWKRNTAATTASGMNNAGKAHPSRVNLMALTLSDGTQMSESMADALHLWTTSSPGRYFNSFADGRQAESAKPGTAGMLNYNRFDLTHFNQDPDTTFFGEDRIMLTTNKKLVPRNADGSYARKFLDIMRDDTTTPIPSNSDDQDITDPGWLDNIAGGQADWLKDPTNGAVAVPNKLDAVVRNLVRYISATNWPLTNGNKSFADKYYGSTSTTNNARLAQIAINIIDYVRAKESKNPVIPPLRFAIDPGLNRYTLNGTIVDGSATAYQGVCRTPCVTEMGMVMDATPSTITVGSTPTTAYKCTFKMELYLPVNYGFTSAGINLVPDLGANPVSPSYGWYVNWSEMRDNSAQTYYFVNPSNGTTTKTTAHATAAVRIFKADLTGGQGPNGTQLTPGNYVTVTKVLYRVLPFSGGSTLQMRAFLYYGLPTTSPAGTGLLGGSRIRWPRVQVGPQASASYVPYAMSPAGTDPNNMCSLETDDPRCIVSKGDWHLVATNTFGSKNSSLTLGTTPTAPATVPQQDTDSFGKITDFSLYMPPPKGIDTNDATHDNGVLTSTAELGYVHTGTESTSGFTSTPWRTIRLQPNHYADATTLPDWALMDLFTVPSPITTDPQGMFVPHGTSVGGRVNVNSRVEPFSTMVRDRGLVAMLLGASSTATPPVQLTLAQAQTTADAIYYHKLATGTGANANNGKVYGYPWTPNPNSTASNAYDTPGEICEIKGVADGGEQSEDIVREISSLTTERSDVFTVYSIGQSIKQTANGKLIVESEQRQQSQVERYLDNKGTPDPSDDEIKFRTVYFRNLTP